MKKVRVIAALAIVCTLLAGSYQSQAAPGERYFPETGHSIRGAFQSYWEQHGGLERFGYPLSDEFAEVSALNDQTYTVQYFERAEFEHHPENAAPYDVLLTQLGTMRYKQKYPMPPLTERVSTDSPTLFPQTGRHVGRLLLNAWRRLGGLANVGYPISEELAEQSPLDGKVYMVQYFERAEFEYHPENATPYDVLLTQLGRFAYNEKYNVSTPTPTALPSTTQFPIRNVAGAPVAANGYLFWINFDPAKFKGDIQVERESAIYGYDLAKQQQFLVTNELAYKLALATDGNTLVWGEYAEPKHNKIMGFDIKTRQVSTVLDTGDSGFGSLALDRGVLYYELNTGAGGLYSYNLSTRQQQLIDQAGSHAVAHDGAVLWQESEFTGQSSPPIITLHLITADNERKDNIITDQSYCFSGYALASDKVVLAYNGEGFDCPPSRRGLYLYDIAGGRITTASSNPAEGVIGAGNLVLWDNLLGDTASFGSLEVYNVDAGVNTPIVRYVQKGIAGYAITGSVLAYTLTPPSVYGSYGGNELYIIDLSTYQPEVASPAAKILSLSNTWPLVVAGRSLFWVSSDCGLCGYDVDSGERYVVTDRPGDKVNVTGNGKILYWLEASPTSRGDIHVFDPTTRRETIAMYGDDINLFNFVVDGNFIYYQASLEGKPGIYQRNILTGGDKLVHTTDRYIAKLVAADGTLVWCEANNGVVFMYLLRSDGSKGDTMFAKWNGYVGSYSVSGDDIVWTEPFQSQVAVNLHHISSNSDDSLGLYPSGTIDQPIVAGKTVAMLVGENTPLHRYIISYDSVTRLNTVTAWSDSYEIDHIALVDQDTLAYSAIINIGDAAIFIVRLPAGAN
ncbi:MAG: hypothetical protein DLM69_05195 [Candidatus Chloroheliales bacterium]|nr:MAG: hypothetical protein DLM69_05195 [Chloroflexota bacterium]